MSVHYEKDGPLAVVTIDRREVANAIDAPTARELADAFRAFEADGSASVAVLTGSAGTFCAGADLKAMRSGHAERVTRLSPEGDGPVGPTRMLLAKPVIAAVEGHAVAGGYTARPRTGDNAPHGRAGESASPRRASHLACRASIRPGRAARPEPT